MSRVWRTFVVTLCVAALGWIPTAAQPTTSGYTVVDLGTLGGVSAYATDVNDEGQVVGSATTPAGRSRAVTWHDRAIADLGTLGGPHSEATALNRSGQVVGRSRFDASSKTHAVLWDNGRSIDLTPEAEVAEATAINASAEIVGTRDYSVAFLWNRGSLTRLPDLGRGGSAANDINDIGQIVGTSHTLEAGSLGPSAHAVLWQNGTVTDLGVLPGDEHSAAAAINGNGHIVGSSGRTDPTTYEVTSRSFLYDGNAMTVLPVPSTESYAADINASGVVVGTMKAAGGSAPYHAYVYIGGRVVNLNTLVAPGSGLHLAYANSINDSGQIAVVAVDLFGRNRAVLLTPSASTGSSTPPPVTPRLAVSDTSGLEGQSGTKEFVFTVSLSSPSAHEVRVSFAADSGSARSSEDFESRSGVLTFAPGETMRSIAILVKGDRKRESDEDFRLSLSMPVGAEIVDGQARGIIRNDDR